MTYDLENNTYSKVSQDNPKDLIAVEVGDSKQPDFLPQVKIQRWDNEVNFSARLIHDEKTPVVTTDVDKILWQGDKVEANFYELTEGYEFEVILKEKPLTNKVEFTLQTKGLDFFYQPELTQEEIDQGSSQPENVIGSYAVYASENKTNYVGGKEYKAGKVGHIYRPKIVDSIGTEVWGELNITGANLSVTIPQDFLDKAVYPVRHAAGLTFGYLTLGASQELLTVDTAELSGTHAAGSADTITSYTYGGRYITDSDRISITAYTVSGGLPSARLAVAIQLPQLPASAGWTTSSTVSQGLSNGVTYCVATGIEVGNPVSQYDASAGTNYSKSAANTLPATWTSASTGSKKYSRYATYTAAGGGVTGPAFMSNRALGRVGT